MNGPGATTAESGHQGAGQLRIMKTGITHVVAGLAEAAGGPSRSVVGLVDSLAKQPDLAVSLIAQGGNGEDIIKPAEGGASLRLIGLEHRWQGQVGLRLSKHLDEFLNDNAISIVHAHGIWNAASYWSAVKAKANGKKLVLHPRGMLEPWCLAHKAWKKSIALALYQQRALNSVDLFFATAEQELESLRRLGLRQPIAVVPNGVDLCPVQDGTLGPRETATRQALFLSRVHPKKGLLNLVAAWASVKREGWRLVVAGSNEGGHWQEVEREISKQGLEDQITYVGPVEGKAKADLYQQSDLFVLPTFSENFGIVIAEALAYGLPVITTRGTPWKDLEYNRCGWWIETGVDPLVAALQQAMTLGDQERQEMGTRGYAYVQRYNWGAIAEQTAAAYRWLVGEGPKPAWVFVD